MKNKLNLPRKDKDGNPYISYSQINSWNDKKSFNLGILGKYEYMRSYFLGQNFGDQGWAMFGEDVENYICYNGMTKKQISELDKQALANAKPGRDVRLVSDSLKSFTPEEEATLNKVKPLGVFQQEGWIKFKGFNLLLYLDDATPDFKHIRDYKTASVNSAKKYEKDDYKQLDIYSGWVRQEKGYIPDRIEVSVIERAGNCFGMSDRRDLLSVKGGLWSIERETSNERIDSIFAGIQSTAEEISEYYTVFQKLNS